MINKGFLVFLCLVILLPSLLYWLAFSITYINIETFAADYIRNLSDRYLIFNLILPFVAYRVNNLTILRDKFGKTSDMVINKIIYRLSILLMIAGLGRLISTIL